MHHINKSVLDFFFKFKGTTKIFTMFALYTHQ